MVLWPNKTLGATDLKYGMYTQLDFGSNMSGIWPLMATPFPIGRLKKNNFQITLGSKELDQQTHFNIYFGL